MSGVGSSGNTKRSVFGRQPEYTFLRIKRKGKHAEKKNLFKKTFNGFITILLLLLLFFWLHGMWDLSSSTRLEPAPDALEGKILTTRPPRKSLRGKAFRG